MSTEQIVTTPAETTTQTPIRPIPLRSATPAPAPVVQEEAYPCSRHSKEQVLASDAVVPGLRYAYWVIRKTDPDPMRPLTDQELATVVICPALAGSVVGQDFQKRHGLYRLSDTQATMNEWRQRLAMRQQRVFERAQRDRGFVNETFTKATPGVDKPRPKYRNRTRPSFTSHRDPNAPKKYGDERRPMAADSGTKRKKRGKGGKNSEENGGKSKQRQKKGR
jgi:hypothetical protein